jgi:hypothetical protein
MQKIVICDKMKKYPLEQKGLELIKTGARKARNYINRKKCVMRNEEMPKKRILKEVQAYNVRCIIIFTLKLIKTKK